MILYKDREIKPIKQEIFNGNSEDYYRYLINEYIPNQPDFEDLMELFIECKFNHVAFLCLLNPTPANLERLKQECL